MAVSVIGKFFSPVPAQISSGNCASDHFLIIALEEDREF
jgi:hypothetical protein